MNGNATNTLEDLVKSMQITGDKAQKALDRCEIGVLSRVIDVDEEGRPAFVVWECSLPSGDGGERRHEMLRLPWDSFYESENVIAELSVEIDCEIREKLPTARDSETHYTLRPGKRGLTCRFGKQQHKFKLSLEADKDYVAEATVDGIPLDEFLEESESLLKEGKAPIFKRIWPGLNILSSRWLILIVVLVTAAITTLLWLRYSGQI